ERSVFAAFDLVPSLLTVAGVAAPDGVAFDGEELSATLFGKSETSREAPIFWRRPPDRKRIDKSPPLPDLAVREGKWKLLCNFDGSRKELYDLEADPGESRNLAEDQSDLAKRLSDTVIAWHRSMPAQGPAAA